MNTWLIYGIGFLGQFFFFIRSMYQWFISEKNKKVITPSIFWKFSLLASFLLFIYGYLRHDFAIMLGQTLTYFIYIRNLQLQGEWKKIHRILRGFLLIFPLFIVIYYFNNNTYDLNNLLQNKSIPFWLLIWGIVAQIIFTFRFIYQWIYSEKNKKSSLPFGFWILSFLGSSMILAYAIYRKDPVLFIGHIFGAIIYIRNIMISRKEI
ncbi:lipid-A-disaccharide synthase N-terminal domain-containing protein [Lutibacter sp.]|uniref:lipid-A-disaccharide synthase N-terminal domain-containing protein n=1 Tax=Lutibacter sp. TaxID=1925666 RepID=UPI0027364E9C|nr:lipid-A-disaccharide synthase N-terminal domain-containing protein [Lutibacter sp.]MDP3312501.1 lipid-A-disaccharide synthase N-terminal domain-containing protein [Lutibacter sp.]